MSSRATSRVRRSEAERRAIVEDFARSGKTRKVFCEETGLPASTLALWQRRAGAGAMRAQFVDVTPVARAGSSWTIDITFVDGTKAQVRG